jgi:hypothetical protein
VTLPLTDVNDRVLVSVVEWNAVRIDEELTSRHQEKNKPQAMRF